MIPKTYRGWLTDDGIHHVTVNGRPLRHVEYHSDDLRDIIRERTQAGLEAARLRGRRGGRKPKLQTKSMVEMARRMHDDKSNSIKDISTALGVSKTTLYRTLDRGRPDDDTTDTALR